MFKIYAILVFLPAIRSRFEEREILFFRFALLFFSEPKGPDIDDRRFCFVNHEVVEECIRRPSPQVWGEARQARLCADPP